MTRLSEYKDEHGCIISVLREDDGWYIERDDGDSVVAVWCDADTAAKHYERALEDFENGVIYHEFDWQWYYGVEVMSSEEVDRMLFGSKRCPVCGRDLPKTKEYFRLDRPGRCKECERERRR